MPIKQYPYLGDSFFVRSRRSPDDLIPIIQRRILGVSRQVPVYDTGSMKSLMLASLDHRRSLLTLVGVFATLALMLSAVGVYGVLAYDVSRRTREIGIRGAVGATPRQIVSLVFAQGLRTTGYGLVLGLVGALLLGRLLTGLLFRVQPRDPLTFGIVAGLLLVVGLLASVLPAWRAARIDPLEALRSD